MATLRLSTAHQEQLNNLQKSQRPRLVMGAGPSASSSPCSTSSLRPGRRKPPQGTSPTPSWTWGWTPTGTRNPDAKDDTGLVKSVGDCLGNHRDALSGWRRPGWSKLPGARLLHLRSSTINGCVTRVSTPTPAGMRRSSFNSLLASQTSRPANGHRANGHQQEPEPVPDDVLDAMLDQLDGPESDDLDPTLDATMNQLDDPELDADYYRD